MQEFNDVFGVGLAIVRHPDVGMIVIFLQEFLCWGRHIFLKESHCAIFQKYPLFEFIEFRTCCCFLILDPSCGDDAEMIHFNLRIFLR